MSDSIDRQAAIDAVSEACFELRGVFGRCEDALKALPHTQPEIIRCKDCKRNPKESWFGCPMSHLSEEQRPETAWCWKGERRADE